MLTNITVSCFNHLYNNSRDVINDAIDMMFCYLKPRNVSNYVCETYGCPIAAPKTEFSDQTVVLLQGVNECMRINENSSARISLPSRAFIEHISLPLEKILEQFNSTMRSSFKHTYNKCITSIYGPTESTLPDLDYLDLDCQDYSIHLHRLQYVAIGIALGFIGLGALISAKRLKKIIEQKYTLTTATYNVVNSGNKLEIFIDT